MFKHYCVIDTDGFYREFVLEIDGSIVAYTLKEGESLLDAPPPCGMDTPMWDGGGWVETGAETQGAEQ
jgi:hypothetical protein